MFNNLRELIATMPDEQTCIKYLVQQRWKGKPVCTFCGCDKYYVIDGGNRYKCSNNTCNMKYSVTTNTIFHASKVPLNKWLNAVYVVSAHKKGISSYQLAKDIGVTQRTDLCLFFILPPVHVSSTCTIVSNITISLGLIASRMRCIINQAVR